MFTLATHFAIGLLMAQPAATAPDAPQGVTSSHAIFISSVSGTANLATWPNSAGQPGLGGADGICRNRALAASLPGAADYVAWMSDTVDDAYCRVLGLSGKRSTSCNGATLPMPAGPWVRTDDRLFAQSLALLTGSTQAALQPIIFNEFGAVSPDEQVFTATDYDGSYYSDSGFSDCGGWSSTNGVAAAGSVFRSSVSWTFSGTAACSQNARLICLRSGSGANLQIPMQNGRPLFLTSMPGNGDLGSYPTANGELGLEAGDQICRANAVAANLTRPESYRALLASSSTSAASRFQFDGPIRRIDGLRIADNFADLFDNDNLLVPPNLTSAGNYLGNVGVWTGLNSNGSTSSATCVDWRISAASAGLVAVPNHVGPLAMSASTAPCASQFYLYCLSNVSANTGFVFVSSTTGTGNLSTWPGAGGQTGLNAADNVCQARAAAVNIVDASQYIAWLSNANTDALCRLRGLSGQVATGCNGGQVGTEAGPWRRPDGAYFAYGANALIGVDAAILHPALITEISSIPTGNTVYTATNALGAYSGEGDCVGWTSTAGQAGIGDRRRTAVSWTVTGTGGCGGIRPLICLRKAPGTLVKPAPSGGRIAFVSSSAQNGNLGQAAFANGQLGLAAGDAICRTLATNAALPQPTRYKALLGNNSTSAASRFLIDGPIQRIDGIRVADNLGELFGGSGWQAPLNTDENGAYLGNLGAWTGSNAFGGVSATNCQNWTTGDSGTTGTRGSVNHVASDAIDSGTPSTCNAQFRLYCIADVDPNDLFRDGFEN